MPTNSEIVRSSPSLQRLRGFAKGLMALTLTIAAGAAIQWSQMAGKLMAAAAGLLLVMTLSTLLSLGKQIDAIQRGPQPERLEPKSPPLFGGFMGAMGLVFVVIGGGCAVVSVLLLVGAISLPEPRWLAPFFAVLFSFVGFINAEIGREFAKTRARETSLRERGLKATALIGNVRQTGVQINDNPQVECVLRVSLPDQEDYDAPVVSVVPLIKIGLLTSGNPVAVFVNPTDKQDIVVDW